MTTFNIFHILGEYETKLFKLIVKLNKNFKKKLT